MKKPRTLSTLTGLWALVLLLFAPAACGTGPASDGRGRRGRFCRRKSRYSTDRGWFFLS